MARHRVLPFLVLLFVGTLCGSMIIPFMGFFIVDGLGHQPWVISLYAGSVAVVTIGVNRRFARWADAGTNPFPLVGIAALGFACASFALSVSPSLWSTLSFGVVGYGLSTSSMSTMFTIGGVLSERSRIKTSTFNAYMRATTSTAWMIGPALSFMAADRLGPSSVFPIAVSIGFLWAVLWWLITPRDVTLRSKLAKNSNSVFATSAVSLRIAATFVFCLSLAHFMTFTALPLFLVQEVGLPSYAPGHAFSMKTFVEIFAILATPVLIVRIGITRSLVGVACVAVGAILFLATVQNYPQMLVGAAIEGFYYGIFSTLGITFVQSCARDHPARATAVYWNTLMVTSVLGGPAAGLIAQAYDFQTVILTAAGVAAFAVIFFAVASRQLGESGRQSI